MNIPIFPSLLTLTAALLVLAAPVSADVYTWRDADGTVHYGDKPGNRSAERLDIETRSTDRAAVAERYETRQTARLESSEAFAEKRAAEATQKAEARKEREEKAARCEKAREKLATYLNSRRLYRVDESGERQYLDDAEITAARARAEEAVNEHCK